MHYVLFLYYYKVKLHDQILHEVCVSSVQNWMVYINSNRLVIATKSKNDIAAYK